MSLCLFVHYADTNSAKKQTRGHDTVPFMYVGIERDLPSAHRGAPGAKLRTSGSESGELASKLQTRKLGNLNGSNPPVSPPVSCIMAAHERGKKNKTLTGLV